MKHIPLQALALCLCLSSTAHAQLLEVTDSSRRHGSAGIEIEATISFTFNQPVERGPASFLVGWDGTFADGGGPYKEPPFLSGDGHTISFIVRHLPNSDYVWFLYGFYESYWSEDSVSHSEVVPYVLTYTTGSSLGTGTIGGTVTYHSGIGKHASAAGTALPTLSGSGLKNLFRTMRPERRVSAASTAREQFVRRAQSRGSGERELNSPPWKRESPLPRQRDSWSGARGHSVSTPGTHTDAVTMGSSREHALVLMLDENSRIGGGAVVDLRDGTYNVDFLRGGTYLPLAIQVFPVQDGLVQRLGFYDADGDDRADRVIAAGSVTGIDLVLHDLDFYETTARQAHAEVHPFVQAQHAAPDYQLVSIEAFTNSLSGRSTSWILVYHSPSTSRLVRAFREGPFLHAEAYEETISSSVRPIPDAFIDSDNVTTAILADEVFAAFLEEHPASESYAWFTAGDLWFDSGYEISPYPERLLWRVEIENFHEEGFTSATVYVDLITSEVVEVDVFVPMEAATAQVFETAAQSLAQEHVVDGSALQLFRIQSFTNEAAFGGLSDQWVFEYFAADKGRIYVELTPFGNFVFTDTWYEHPENGATVPEEYVDSDRAAEIAESAGGKEFRAGHGGSIWVEGGLLQEAEFGRPEYLSRAVWSIRYMGDEGGSMAVYLDMATGELLEAELYEPLLPATAKTHENRAFELVSTRVEDANSLQLFQVTSFGGFFLDDRLHEGISGNWGYSYLTSDEGLVSVHLNPWGYAIHIDTHYSHPVGAPVMPQDYIDSDAALGIADASGGAAFRERHREVYMRVEGGFAWSFQFQYPQYATIPVWAVQYSAEPGSKLTIFIDVAGGDVLEVDAFEARTASSADDAQGDALALASEQLSDPTGLQLFRIFTAISFPLEGTAKEWQFSYRHPNAGRVDVSLYEDGGQTIIDPQYTHPSGAPVVPDDHLDSDDALAIAEATNEVRMFRAQFGHRNVLMEGGFAEQLASGDPLYSSRPVWFMQYHGEGSYPPPALNLILDMTTGDVLGSFQIGTAKEEGSDLPTRVDLHPNYPNPFNPSTTIHFDLPHAMEVSISIYDVLGREVTRLLESQEVAGSHTVVWDAAAFASGVYIARLSAGGKIRAHTLILQK